MGSKLVNSWHQGFTLTELLIALAILGIIATFTIPKVLQSQSDGKYKAIAKETVASIVAAHQNMQLAGKLSVTTVANDITPYLNYVARDTVSDVDSVYNGGTVARSCTTYLCVKLHNGAILRLNNGVEFGGSSSTNAILIAVDPDGKVTDGTTNGPGRAVNVWIYYDGKVRDFANILPNTCDEVNCYNPTPTQTPPWFSWE